jgi:hypothetical protein
LRPKPISLALLDVRVDRRLGQWAVCGFVVFFRRIPVSLAERSGSLLMARISGLTLAAGAAMLLLQPTIAQADSGRPRHSADRQSHYAAYAYPYRGPNVIFAFSPFYGPFGGHEDTFWAEHYPGPVERRYYGYGWDPRLRF